MKNKILTLFRNNIPYIKELRIQVRINWKYLEISLYENY